MGFKKIASYYLLRKLRTNHIQRTARLKPLDLLFIIGMIHRDLIR